MRYVIVHTDNIEALQRHVNQWIEDGYTPVGGMTAVRERVSGPVYYTQAVFQTVEIKIQEGPHRGASKRKDLFK